MSDASTFRLAKRMAMLGMCSRREADSYILRGLVQVNGITAVLKGQPVTAADKITMDAAATAEQQGRVTILLNKPIGYVSAQPEQGYRAAAELFVPQNRWKEDTSGIIYNPMQAYGLAPAGRLDIDSVGLLVLTQDGVVARQLIGENSEVSKEYLVRTSGKIVPNGLALLRHGLSLDGEALRPAQVSWERPNVLRFILRQGKKRQLRRMCQLVGLHVTHLERIRIGNIWLGGLSYGQWRYLAADEHFV